MKITDQAEQDRIMQRVSELRDGLTVMHRQGLRVLDCHACFGIDTNTDEYYFITEYAHHNDEPELFNFSYMTGTDIFARYKKVGQTVYTTRQEMHDHIARFVADNHF